MDKLAVIFIIVGLFLSISLLVLQSPVESIPPTDAIYMINTTSGNVTASRYNSFVEFIGSGITITPNYSTNEITFTASNGAIPKLDNQTAQNDFQIIGINNVTGAITTNQFSVNSKTCSGTDKISAVNNVTGTVTCTTDTSGGGSNALLDGSVHTDTTAQTVSRGSLITGQGGSPTWNELVIGGAGTFLKSDGTDVSWGAGDGAGAVTLGADSTCTATATYCTIWTIPLTASSGNRLDVQMVGDSNTAGSAIQMRVQFDNAGNTGYCVYRTYTGAAAETLDVLAATAATDTGETAWLAGANVPMPLDIQCGFETDASPGNALVQIQMEAASTGTIQKGSNYIKTP